MQAGFLSKRRNLIIGVLLGIVALGIFTSGRLDSGPVGRSIGVIGVGAQSAVDGVEQFFAGLVRFIGLGPSENDLLRAEAESLRKEVTRVKELEAENERLRTMLDFKRATTLQLLPARIVGRSATAWYRSLTLDHGLESGVRNGMPVVTAAGVVGRIYEVSSGYCRVLLLTDASSAVDAIVQRTRAQVIVEGNLSPRPNLLYLAKGVEAEVGDKIVTSGLDGFYPKGLLMGEIGTLRTPPGEIYREAKMDPSVDFGRLEDVFVVTSQSGYVN